jgi:2-haloacid dehalogenase
MTITSDDGDEEPGRLLATLHSTQQGDDMAKVLVFDVNETLLDLRALDPIFERVFGEAAARREWFGQMLQSAFVSIIIDAYADFGATGGAALRMIAAKRGVTLDQADLDAVKQTMRELPAYPDVRPALEQLRDAGFRLATLTNSTAEVGEAQVTNAGLRDLFEQTLSADTVRRLKPAPEPYRMAAERLGVGMGDMMLVAAHFWDVAGAMRAGCRAAFVARPGQVLDPLAPEPDIVGKDLTEVTAAIIAAGG